MTVNVHNLLPASAGEWWPKWVNLAMGYGVSGYVHNSPNLGIKRKMVFGLDLNLSSFETGSTDVQVLQKSIDMIHLPAPAIKYVEDRHPDYRLLFLY